MLLVGSHQGTPEKIVRKKIRNEWERGDRKNDWEREETRLGAGMQIVSEKQQERTGWADR